MPNGFHRQHFKPKSKVNHYILVNHYIRDTAVIRSVLLWNPPSIPHLSEEIWTGCHRPCGLGAMVCGLPWWL